MEQLIAALSPFIPAAAFLAFLLGDAFSDAYHFQERLRKQAALTMFKYMKENIGQFFEMKYITEQPLEFKALRAQMEDVHVQLTWCDTESLTLKGFKPSPNTLWHRWQAVRQAAMIALAAFSYGSLPALIVFSASFWLIHDGIVNRVGLNRTFFFVGTTAWLDRQFQKTRHPELFMGVAKLGLLVAGIILLLIKAL